MCKGKGMKKETVKTETKKDAKEELLKTITEQNAVIINLLTKLCDRFTFQEVIWAHPRCLKQEVELSAIT